MSNTPPEYYLIAVVVMAVLMGVAMLTMLVLDTLSCKLLMKEKDNGETNPKTETSETEKKTTNRPET